MDTAANERLARGRTRMAEVTGEPGAALVQRVEEQVPDLARFVVEFGFGDVYSRPGLDDRQRQLVTISALCALGAAEPQLAVHVEGALNVGLTPDEVLAAIVHCTPYVGFPRALNAAATAHRVIEARGASSRRDGNDSATSSTPVVEPASPPR